MRLDRHRIRSLGAVVSGAMAAIYFGIGLGVLGIGGSTSGESVDLAAFGFGAGSAFLVLALLLLRTDHRWLWVLALVAQAWVFVVYFAVSGTREPPFEVWGILLRALHVPLMLVLAYLAWRAPTRHGVEAQPA